MYIRKTMQTDKNWCKCDAKKKKDKLLLLYISDS